MFDPWVFSHLDTAILRGETRSESASKRPIVWPSEARAVLCDQLETPVIGRCIRASFWRLSGKKISNQIDVIGAWRFRTGRLMEHIVTELAQESGIYVASGVRFFSPELLISLELDIIVRNLVSQVGAVVENKSTYGYVSGSKIYKKGEPKWDNVIQIMLYRALLPTGSDLKRAIEQGVQAKMKALANTGSAGRNRIDVSLESLAKMSDAPLDHKLTYVSRDDCQRREFDVQFERAADGFTYPKIDGEIYRVFTLESVFESYHELQRWWYKARDAALDKLGVEAPEEPGERASAEERQAYQEFWNKVGDTINSLGWDYVPPADYQFAYSPEKIEKLWEAKRIGKTKYEGWKKKHKGKTLIGDWQCRYCPFKLPCVAHERPDLTYLIRSIEESLASEEE